MCSPKVDKAVTNAILRSGARVFSEWKMIDWVLIKNDDTKLMIESITIEKGDKTRKLTCDALFNFYEKTIDLNAFLGNMRDIAHQIYFRLCLKSRSINIENPTFHMVYRFSILSSRSRFRWFAGNRSGVSHQRSVYFCRWYRDEIFQEVLCRRLATQILRQRGDRRES